MPSCEPARPGFACCASVVRPTLLYMNYEAVIPANAGIQHRKTGFLVKPGITIKVKRLLMHYTSGKSGQMDWQQITSSRLWIVRRWRNLLRTLRHPTSDSRHGRQVFGSRPENHAEISIVSPESQGFIRAEVVAYEGLDRCGSLAATRHEGSLRLEGKDYLVADGDIMTIRFNV